MKRKDHYKRGLEDGINVAKKTVKNDIKSIYGMMAVIMLERGQSEDDVESMIIAIQDRWNSIASSGESLESYLREHLPIDMVQIS